MRLDRRLRQLGGTVPDRLRSGLVAAGAATLVVALAFAGGAISGTLDHAAAPLATLPPPTTTSTTGGPPATTPQQLAAAVEAQAVEDMTLDVRSQRLSTDMAHRAALAVTPAAVAARHTDIATAWAPEKVAALEVAYDHAVSANAADPRSPSVTDGTFIVTRWTSVTVAGTGATIGLVGHYRLIEPANRAARNGAVDQRDEAWRITLRQAAGRWRLVDRAAV